MKKILIADEIKSFVEEEECILKRSDIKIFTARSGQEALAMHKAHKMSLIIASLEMADLPGDKLFAAIRADEEIKRVSLIIICGKKKTDIERCAACGANTYITRPIDPDELRENVGKLLDIPHRKNLRVLIKVSVKGHFRSEPFFCTSENISESGLLLEASRVLAKGDAISCSFFVPDEDRILADCEVVRVDKKGADSYRYGLTFLNIEHDYIAAIKRFVAKNRAQRAC